MKGKQNKSPQGTASASALPAIRGMRCTLSLFTLQSVAPCGTLRMVQDCTRHTDGTAACRTPPLPPSGGSGICSGDSSLDSRQNSPRLQVLLFAFFSKERKKLSLFFSSSGFSWSNSASLQEGGRWRRVWRCSLPCQPSPSAPYGGLEGERSTSNRPRQQPPSLFLLEKSRGGGGVERRAPRTTTRVGRGAFGVAAARRLGLGLGLGLFLLPDALAESFVAPRLARLDIPLTCPPGAQYGPVGGPR